MRIAGDDRSGRPVVIFAGGGTGGHLYPALSVAEALRTMLPDVRFVFMSTTRKIDQHILDQASCEVVRQPLTPLSMRPWRWPAIMRGLSRASRVSRAQIAARKPVVVIGTGGLGSVPAVRQAVRAGVPTAILNPDAVPGRANRMLARRVDVVFAQFEQTIGAVPSGAHVEVAGCPVRSAFLGADRAAGLARFGLDPSRKTLLITGASQGARTINQAVLANRGFLSEQPDWQVIHLAGALDVDDVKCCYSGFGAPVSVMAYTDHMPEAIAAADLVVSRAGASTLAELTAMGKPSILFPYPFDRARHQSANAACVAQAGAAHVIDDAADLRVNAPALRAALESLMRDDALRAQMASCAAVLGRPNAAKTVASRLLAVAQIAPTRGPVETLKQTC